MANIVREKQVALFTIDVLFVVTLIPEIIANGIRHRLAVHCGQRYKGQRLGLFSWQHYVASGAVGFTP